MEKKDARKLSGTDQKTKVDSRRRDTKRKKLSHDFYEQELAKLQVGLAELQAWIRHKGLRVIVVFEGRDAAGKGGLIKRITERVSPRVFRIVALPAPSDREKTQFYLQRYVKHLPAAGEVVLFDRSWYNRMGVERVMGFCTDDEYERFKANCAGFERALIKDGIILVKYWLTVSNKEQEKRFRRRIEDPVRQWKLSPMDTESRRRWYDYSRARDAMLAATDTDYAPWTIVPSDDKRRARLNCISHLLSQIPYKALPKENVKLPARDTTNAYDDQASLVSRRHVPEKY
ncbi:polyphosphate kinase 2 [Desulfosarcina sp.]|uniref:polyphosphate kinase 2 n=1 Tax=Desulfosarcina sp. TaxID=2027861 RepID=UPI0039708083